MAKKIQNTFLRAPDQKYRESHDRNEISYSILIYQKYLFGKLFSKIIFKSSSAFCFFFKFLDRGKNDVLMSQMVKRERFPLLRTSLLKMHDFPLFPGGAGKLLAVF